MWLSTSRGPNDFVLLVYCCMVIRVLPDLSVLQNLSPAQSLQSWIICVTTSYGTTRYDRGKLAETRRYGNYRCASAERQSCATRQRDAGFDRDAGFALQYMLDNAYILN